MLNNLNLDSLLAPAKKIADLQKVQIEKAIASQQAATKEYVSSMEARIKAATAIKDMEGLNAFVKDQVELAKSAFEKVQADSKVLVEDAKAYNEEIMKLVKESSAVATKEVKTTVKQIAKKAA